MKPTEAEVLNLQKTAGNQAVQRLLAQRQAEDGFDLDEDTAERINQARGNGQPLDANVQAQMSERMGHDFSGVRVHSSPEADDLNQRVGAKAFTTGQDIFFKEGAYDPASSSGQELIAHELTHVVQQGSGQVGSSGSGMTVRPAGDALEQEADAMAKQAISPGSEASPSGPGDVQRAEEEIEAKSDDMVQREQDDLEEDEDDRTRESLGSGRSRRSA